MGGGGGATEREKGSLKVLRQPRGRPTYGNLSAKSEQVGQVLRKYSREIPTFGLKVYNIFSHSPSSLFRSLEIP